ncbi:hypothetical protein ADUPG1_008050 [Aduncisulcus paluster]|uniref:Uncharacterized protein n=1 Tax=Aduncisulcus paluster TaxID=2918883 RepID=A0ABQ5KQM9_9EUKA|nr:hypothetical protein ADUPG1_008050 [Aduncisulcus paluster]
MESGNNERVIILLNKDLELAKQRISRLAMELEEERRNTEEKDRYIDILKKALDKRAENFGMTRGGEFMYDLTDLETENEQYRVTIQEQSQKIEDMNEDLLDIKESYDMLERRSQEALDEAEKTIQTEIENHQDLISQRKQLEETISQLHDEKKKYDSDHKLMKKELEECNAENEQLYSIQQELLTSLTELQDKFDDIQWYVQRCDEYEKSESLSLETIETLKKRLESVQTKYIESQQSLKKLQVEFERTREERDVLRTEKESLEEREGVSSKTLSSINLELIKLKEKHRDTSEALKEVQSKNESIKLAKTESDREMTSIREECEQAQGELAALRSRTRELEELTEEQKRIIANNGDEIKSLCNAIAIVRQKGQRTFPSSSTRATMPSHMSNIVPPIDSPGPIMSRHGDPIPSLSGIASKPIDFPQRQSVGIARDEGRHTTFTEAAPRMSRASEIAMLRSQLDSATQEAAAVKKARQVERRLLEGTMREIRERSGSTERVPETLRMSMSKAMEEQPHQMFPAEALGGGRCVNVVVEDSNADSKEGEFFIEAVDKDTKKRMSGVSFAMSELHSPSQMPDDTDALKREIDEIRERIARTQRNDAYHDE